MKKMIIVILLLISSLTSYCQNNSDSIRYYSMLNFIIENKSMLNPYLSLIEKEESNLHISLREGILSYLIEKEGQLNKKDSAYFQKYLMEISNNEVVNYDLAKWHVIHDPTTKLFNIPASVNDQLRQYFHGLKENKLDSAIRYNFNEYRHAENPISDLFFERMNAFLDSILRNGESVDRSKSFWAISFSDSFYEYNSALIYYCPNVRGRIIKILLEIVFLFDERNRIKMVDLSIIRT